MVASYGADKTEKSGSGPARRRATVQAEGSETPAACRTSTSGINDDELFEGYLEVIHEPQEAQLAKLSMIHSKLSEHL